MVRKGAKRTYPHVAKGTATDEPVQQVTGMVEIEAELQVELEYIQMEFLQ